MIGRTSGPASRVGRILIVENSPSARRLLQDVLLRLGAELPDLRIAASVSEALVMFTQWRPDLVFVDVELDSPADTGGRAPPRAAQDPKDGAELAQLFLSRNPSVRIVLCSATDPSDRRLAGLRTEAQVDFIVKPLVAARVEEILAKGKPPVPRRSA